jgi:Tfp pilus assembly pilus retraction ATPase PilT
MAINLDRLLRTCRRLGELEFYLVDGATPCLRAAGNLREIRTQNTNPAETMEWFEELATEPMRRQIRETGKLELSFGGTPNVDSRFSLTIFNRAGFTSLILREEQAPERLSLPARIINRLFPKK